MNNNFENMGNGIKKKEVRIMIYKPLIESWDLLVRQKDMEECVRRLRVFAEFWQNLSKTKLDMPADIILRGKVYGREGFVDGDEICTSWVKTVERIERGDRNGVPHDLICATTHSGSKYYFYSDTHTADMGLLLGGLIHLVPNSRDDGPNDSTPSCEPDETIFDESEIYEDESSYEPDDYESDADDNWESDEEDDDFLDIPALALHFCGINVSERLNNLSKNEIKIIRTLYEVDFEDYDELQEVAEELQDIDGSEVLKCISDYWRAECIFDGIENLEEIFDANIDIGTLIGSYFADNDHWWFNSDSSEWLVRFSNYSGHDITADDVTKNISMDYLIDSHAYGPGLCGFFEFLEENGGDPKLFIKKVAAEVDRLPHIDIEDIVYCMTPYIDDGDIDMQKLFSRVDWEEVRKDDEDIEKFTEFFKRFAPDLVAEIP